MAAVKVEPVLPHLMDEQEQAALGGAVARTGELAADGRLTAAMRAFAGFPFNDEDISVAADAGYFRRRRALRPDHAHHLPAIAGVSTP